MRYMKTFILILIALLIVTFSAGCNSKETKETDKSVKTTEIVDSGKESSILDGSPDSKIVANSDSKDKESSSSETDTFSGTAKELYPDANIDPYLEELKIENNNPDVILTKLEFIDERDSESSDNWGIRATLKYEGDEPTYIAAQYEFDWPNYPSTINGGWNYESRYGELYTYNKGNELTPEIDAGLHSHEFDTSKTASSIKLVIDAHKKTLPDVSDDFPNLKNISACLGAESVDLKSIKLISSEQNESWKSVVVEFEPPKETFRSISVYLVGPDGKNLRSKYGTDSFSAEIGKDKENICKFELLSNSSEDIYEIKYR